MTDANYEGFPICDDRITENDRCVIKIIGIHCKVTKFCVGREELINVNKLTKFAFCIINGLSETKLNATAKRNC